MTAAQTARISAGTLVTFEVRASRMHTGSPEGEQETRPERLSERYDTAGAAAALTIFAAGHPEACAPGYWHEWASQLRHACS